MISRISRNCVRIRQIRLISSILNNPNTFTVEDLKKSNFDGNIADSIKLLETVNKSNNSSKSELIQHLIPSFSTYFKLPKQLISPEVLLRLIQINPGRVHSSIELFEKYEQNLSTVQQEIIDLLINKLLKGESYEINESEQFKPSEENLSKLVNLLTKYPINDFEKVDLLNQIEDERLLSSLLSEKVLTTSNLVAFLEQNQIKNVESSSKLLVLKQIFSTAPELLSIGQIQDILIASRANNDKQLNNDVSSYILQQKLDIPADALSIRIELIEQYGIYNDDLDQANKLYHKYQSHSKYGIDLIQYQLFKSYIYQSVNKDSQEYQMIANTLVNPNGLNVKSLQCLIISNYNNDQGLDTFNDYIGQASKEVDAKTQRSSSGKLTEAVIISTLLDNDRNFADIILHQGTEHGALSESEVGIIKKHFKAYGNSFTDSDEWSEAKPRFKQHVLSFIKNL